MFRRMPDTIQFILTQQLPGKSPTRTLQTSNTECADVNAKTADSR